VNLSNQALIDLRRAESAKKRQQRCIAHSVFDRLASDNTFQLNFDLFMSHKSNLLYVNKNVITLNMVFAPYKPRICTHEIAYFRYLDGSTVKLVDSAYYYIPPCLTCSDVQKCTCHIEGLSL